MNQASSPHETPASGNPDLPGDIIPALRDLESLPVSSNPAEKAILSPPWPTTSARITLGDADPRHPTSSKTCGLGCAKCGQDDCRRLPTFSGKVA